MALRAVQQIFTNQPGKFIPRAGGMTAYLVAWTWDGERHEVDVDTERMASVLCLVLAECQRGDVMVTEIEGPASPDMRLRVWAALQARNGGGGHVNQS